MDRDIKNTVKAYKAAKAAGVPFLAEDNNMCLRGLEEHLSTGVQRCCHSKKLHFIRGVMREQKRKRLAHHHHGKPFFISNGDSSAHLLSTSTWALKKALARGTRDALDALDDLNNAVVDDDDVPRFDTPHSVLVAAAEEQGLLVEFPETPSAMQRIRTATIVPDSRVSREEGRLRWRNPSFSNESTRQRPKSQHQHKRWNLVSLQQVHSALVAPC